MTCHYCPDSGVLRVKFERREIPWLKSSPSECVYAKVLCKIFKAMLHMQPSQVSHNTLTQCAPTVYTSCRYKDCDYIFNPVKHRSKKEYVKTQVLGPYWGETQNKQADVDQGKTKRRGRQLGTLSSRWKASAALSISKCQTTRKNNRANSRQCKLWGRRPVCTHTSYA